jgi:hypothetical protein
MGIKASRPVRDARQGYQGYFSIEDADERGLRNIEAEIYVIAEAAELLHKVSRS